MKISTIENELNSLAYHGRGIIIGKSADGKKAVTAYFIMGRSENSRNRVFVEDGAGIRTQAFDPSKLVDPSLIIYAPVRVLGNKTIVTNGDQTDTIYDLMDKQMTFEQALRTREFEDDAPNFTPRISGIIKTEEAHNEAKAYSAVISEEYLEALAIKNLTYSVCVTVKNDKNLSSDEIIDLVNEIAIDSGVSIYDVEINEDYINATNPDMTVIGGGIVLALIIVFSSVPKLFG